MPTLHYFDSMFVICGAIILAFSGMTSAENSCDSIRDSNHTFEGKAALSIPPGTDSPQPRPSPLEKDLFFSTWWGNHAAFVADFATTGMIIRGGGIECDPVFTAFGDRNLSGVIGSAIVFHAAESFLSFELFKLAQKRHGAWRFVLSTAATGINAYLLGVHTAGTINNVNQYNTMKK